jgi:protein TonB
LPSYRIPSAYDRPPLRRRASGLALALGINALLLLVLLGLGVKPPPGLRQSQPPLVIDLVRESARAESQPEPAPQPLSRQSAALPAVKPPPIVLPVKPTITPPPRLDMLEMTPQEYAAADIAKLPKAGAGGSGANDSEEVGRGPNGEILYAAEWARRAHRLPDPARQPRRRLR